MTVESGELAAHDVLALADLQLGQVVAEAGDQLIELDHLGNGFDGVPGGDQRRGHRLARPADTGGIIGEDASDRPGRRLGACHRTLVHPLDAETPGDLPAEGRQPVPLKPNPPGEETANLCHGDQRTTVGRSR